MDLASIITKKGSTIRHREFSMMNCAILPFDGPAQVEYIFSERCLEDLPFTGAVELHYSLFQLHELNGDIGWTTRAVVDCTQARRDVSSSRKIRRS